MVILPECFNAPYVELKFNKNAEYVPNGPTCTQLSSVAKELKIYLVGTLMERDPANKDTIYNTATVWSPDGKMIAKHRKVHLYDVDITDYNPPTSYHETHYLTPGNQVTTFEIEGIKFGLLICNDIMYDEWAKLYRKEGCDMLIYPVAFNPTIGPLFWDLVTRARALDNQVYLAGVSAARDDNAPYVDWGRSTITDPFGRIVQQADDKERIMYQVIDFAKVAQLRQQVYTWKGRRTDIYDLIRK